MYALISRAANLVGRDSPAVSALRPLYRMLLAAVYHDRGMPWQLNGTPVRIDPALREEMGQEYDPAVVAWLRPRVRPGDVVWNVGANVGVYTLQLANWVGPTGCVVAVEPNPGARAALERHLRWNGLASRVQVVAMAVGASIGETTMWVDGANPMGAVGEPNPSLADRAHVITVPITTLDALVASGRPAPDWIVMDIEGYELYALNGARDVIEAGGDALGIVLELHPGIWQRIGAPAEMLDELLQRHRRRITPLRGDGDPHDIHSIVALEPIT